jgi:NAD(P)-dependent dehydrogenase (short-subunit alcohol dehydrogenase family)
VLLTKSVASQYGTRGIRCNAVAPGLTLTAGAVNNASKEYIEASLRNYPMPFSDGDASIFLRPISSLESVYDYGRDELGAGEATKKSHRA